MCVKTHQGTGNTVQGTRKCRQLLEDVRSQCCNLHPEGYTAADFMAVWNRQYEDRIKELETAIDQALLRTVQSDRNREYATCGVHRGTGSTN